MSVIPKIFYRRRIPFHIHTRLPLPILISQPLTQGLTLSYNMTNNDIVNWVINNGTSTTKYVVIYRGAFFSDFTIPPYPFGNAFYPVYAGTVLGQKASIPIQHLDITNHIQNLINNQIYPLGMINNNIVAFVFPVPPNSQLIVPEGGFSGVKQLIYTLVEVTPEKLHRYLIFWDPIQWLDFVAQTGFSATPVSLPWFVKMYNFTTNVNMSTAYTNFVFKVS